MIDENASASCISCEWTGLVSDGDWQDMSGLATDSMCDRGGEGDGVLLCPECDEPCEINE